MTRLLTNPSQLLIVTYMSTTAATTTTTTSTRESFAMFICSTCVRPVDAPYRRHNEAGDVIEGCISSAHEHHADAWHLRPEAYRMRSQLLLGIAASYQA